MQVFPESIPGNSASSTGNQSAIGIAKPYKTPTLTNYGSVVALTQGGASGTTESTSRNGTSRKSSDFRLKENLNRIGQHPLGFGLYLFDYKPDYQAEHGHGRQFGVMAQEVEPVVPAAISVNAAGFKLVDYALLGIQPTLH